MSRRERTKKAEPKLSTSEQAQIKQNAVEELEDLGKQIKARVAKMEKAQAAIAEKSGRDVKDWIDYRDSIAKLLADAREKCKVAQVKFKEFREKHAPGFGRTQLYELLRVGRGVLTIEDQRQRERLKKQTQRAPKKAAEPSGTGDVPDTRARPVTGSNTMSDEEAKGRMVGLDGEGSPAKAEKPVASEVAPPAPAELGPEQPPAQPRTLTAEEISDDALAAFKKTCWDCFGKMLEPDRKKARVFFNEYMAKLTEELANRKAA